MPEKVAPVAWAELRPRRAPTPRRWSVALVGAAVTPVLRVMARRVSAALMEHLRHAPAALVALAASAERAAIAVPAVPAAVVLPGRAPVVVLVLRAQAALVAVAALAAPGLMRAASAMARLVGMLEQAALVAWAVLRARRVQTPRPCLVVPAGPEATPERRARVRPVRQARLAP